jgi:hypothetical protein
MPIVTNGRQLGVSGLIESLRPLISARCFRADRIIEAVDLFTGEIFDPAALREHFWIENEAETEASPRAQTKQALHECRHALNILVYLARCDGFFHPEEENIIINYIATECFTCNFDDEFLLKRVRSHYPDMDTFFNSLDYLRECAPDSLKKIGKFAAQLVQADDVISVEEAEFMAELQNYLA